MSKKEQERPRFRCDKCGCKWVYHSPICILCGIPGKPMNRRAERIIKKLWGDNNDGESRVNIFVDEKLTRQLGKIESEGKI